MVKLARFAVHVQSEPAQPLRIECSLCERAAVIECYACHRFYCGRCYVSYHDVDGKEFDNTKRI